MPTPMSEKIAHLDSLCAQARILPVVTVPRGVCPASLEAYLGQPNVMCAGQLDARHRCALSPPGRMRPRGDARMMRAPFKRKRHTGRCPDERT